MLLKVPAAWRCALPALVAGCITIGSSPQRHASFVDRTITENGVAYPYQVFIPTGHDTAQRWPVILFLHGRAEAGRDGKRQLSVGIGPALRRRPERVPAIVVLPQAPTDSIWSGSVARRALRALDETMFEFRGDSDRVYVTGISMGAYGTWQLAMARPDRFAALVPIAGGVRSLMWAPQLRVTGIPDSVADPYAHVAQRVGRVPVWMFHNARDVIVPASESRRMVEALRHVGARVRYTEYPSPRHDAWTAAYDDPELWRWLFAQRIGGR